MRDRHAVYPATPYGQSMQENVNDSLVEPSSRHSHRRRHRRRPEAPLLIGVLALSLLVFVLLFFGVIKFNSMNSGNELLRAKLQELQDDLAASKAELSRTREDLEAAVEGRFPQLYRLEFDRVVPIHNGYLKNIVFTVLNQSNQRRYEYKLVLQNSTELTAIPAVKVLIFDRLGVQLGVDELPKQEPLARGETRSFSSVVELSIPGEPRYFYVMAR